MRLTMKERQSVTAVVAARYRRTGKKDKKTILNEFTQVTGYNRSYAGFLLRAWGKRVRINNKLVLVGDGRKKIKRDRPRVYDDNVLCALKKIWMIMDCICGKRLAKRKLQNQQHNGNEKKNYKDFEYIFPEATN